MVVDANCMKDLDCVGSCPHNAISFGFARPALARSFSRSGRRAMRYDFSLVEDVLMAVVFLATLFIFRGLYGVVPFLMTLGLGGILAFAAVLTLRLRTRPNVRLGKWQLRRSGRLTGAGQAFACAALLAGMFTVHSAFVRYHESRGHRAYVEARQAERPPIETVGTAIHHLSMAGRFGLFRPLALHERIADLHLMSGEPSRAISHFRAIIDSRPDDLGSRLALTQVLLASGRPADAATEAERLLARGSTMMAPERDGHDHRSHTVAEAHLILAQLLEQSGRLDESIAHLEAIVAMLPDSAGAHRNLGMVLTQAGRWDDASAHMDRAKELDAAAGDQR